MTLCCIISEIKWNVDRKSRFFIPVPAFDTRVGRGVLSEYCHNVWRRKTRMVSHVWVPLVKKKLMMCLAVSTLYRRVSDGQTNGIVCAYAGHRAVKKGTLGRYGVVVVIIIDKLYNIDASPIPSHFTTHSASSYSRTLTADTASTEGREARPGCKVCTTILRHLSRRCASQMRGHLLPL